MAELGVEPLLGLRHLVGGAGGEAQQRPPVLAGGFTDRLQRVGSAAALVQRVHPVGEAGDAAA